MAEIWIHEGESIENALRRFKRKVMQESVEHCRDSSGIAEQLAPIVHGSV